MYTGHMSVSITIEAVIPYEDDKFQQMKAVYDACTAAGVELPGEVSEFFYDADQGGPCVWPDGKRVDLKYGKACAVSGDVMYDGAYIHLSELPAGTKLIRVGSSC